MTISMKQIARLADVHESTVSKVLNNYPDVGNETTEKVLNLIRELGYQRNHSAVRLSRQQTFTIGVVLYYGLGDYQSMEALRGINSVINENSGYDILLNTVEWGRRQYSFMRLFHQRKVDSILVVFPLMNDSGVSELENNNARAVLVGAKSDVLDYANNDNRKGVSEIIGNFVEAGHKRIGMIHGKNSTNYIERREAYRETLDKHSISYVKELDVLGDFPADMPAGYGSMKEMLLHKPTAVFASTDRLALGAMKAIQDAGLRIPEDIAIAGYDDLPQAAEAVPPLTTVRLPFFEMGAEAAKIALGKLGEKLTGQQKIVVPPELIIRDSTTPVKKG